MVETAGRPTVLVNGYSPPADMDEMTFSPTTIDSHGDATTELHLRAGALGASATRRLQRLQQESGLNQRRLQLLSTNLGIAQDWQHQPSISHFWTAVAEPCHDLFVAEGVEILSDVARRMTDLLNNVDIRPNDVPMRCSAVVRLAESLFLPDDVIKLGDRWLRELQLRAVARVAGNVATGRTVSFATGYRCAELELLDSTPWCYQDRLLAAFEAAYRQLSHHRTDLIDYLQSAATRPVDDCNRTTLFRSTGKELHT